MISRENQLALRERGTSYILGARLKSRPAAQKRTILDPENHEPWNRDEDDDGLSISRLCCIDDDGGRLIATYSPRRARKDAHDRDRLIERTRNKLKNSKQPAAHSNRGAARFLDFPGGEVRLNKEKIRKAALWDGLRGIVAWGRDDDDPRDLVRQYRRLSEIESCFRTNKHDLAIRPIFHWKPRRIRAHIAICYMAFCCLQHLRQRLKIQGHPMSPDRIRRALNDLQISILTETGGDRTFRASQCGFERCQADLPDHGAEVEPRPVHLRATGETAEELTTQHGQRQ